MAGAVQWATDPTQPFSTPFNMYTAEGRIWIAPADGGERTAFHFKGANWAGFQASGCVHELYKHQLQEYIDFLVLHNFNSVRLPMSVEIIGQNAETSGLCGEFTGWHSLDILDDLIARLQQAGIFVMFDMHTLERDAVVQAYVDES